LDNEAEYEKLYRRLTNQPEVQRPKLGERRVLPQHDFEERSIPLNEEVTGRFGTRYEGLWTIFCMRDVIDDRADTISLEPPGEEEEGIEFRIRRGGTREYHQVKRQHGVEGRWTLMELGSRMVLSACWDELNDPAARCVVVSSHPAHQLSELIESAVGAKSWEEFDRRILAAQHQSQNFSTLCSLWGNCPREEAFERLRRISTKTIDESLLGEMGRGAIAGAGGGNLSTASNVLFQLALDRVHEQVTAQDMWLRLGERGMRRRDWVNDTPALAKLEEANASYLFSIRNELIFGESIPREETRDALASLTSVNSRRGVLLSGEAGVGKSGVVLQVLEELREREVPILAFRVDRLVPTLVPKKSAGSWGCPARPSPFLGA
jgi:hypothetical protein